MESRVIKIKAEANKNVVLKLLPGHFATSHSHVNYYLDMTTMKTRSKEAREAARTLAGKYAMSTIVDTIVCLDGTEVIGTFLADELSNAGIMSMNMHQTMYVVEPEFKNDQMIFRDNIQPMVKNKNVIVLVASATTGKTIQTCIESIRYYGGTVQGISAIFSNINKIDNIEVNTIFRKKDIPNYDSFTVGECPKCQAGERVEAIVNSYGYSKL